MSSTDKIFNDNNPPQAAAADLNGFNNETLNLILGSGQTPSTSDNEQTHKAVSIYAAGGNYYTDSGSANAYILSTVDSKIAPPAYFDGMSVIFVPGNTNTGASTVNPAALGVKNIFFEGSALTGGELPAGLPATLRYDEANDRFNIEFSKTIFQNAPIGEIITWPTNSPPTSFLECDGTAVSRTTYSALFGVIGTTFGIGDGSTTFNLPDLRAEFVRGWDNGRGIDTGRVFASAQGSQNLSHTHNIGVADSGGVANTAGEANTGTPQSTKVTDASGGSEARPRNIALMYCIRYA